MAGAVVFDLDDTLISEKKYIESGYHYIAKILARKFDIVEEVVFRDLLSLLNESSKNVFNRLLEKHGFNYTHELILSLVNEYRNHFPNIEFYDDVLPCLDKLKSKHIKIGIITDGYSCAQKLKLKAVMAFDFFDEIIITDDLGAGFWKPHPKAFQLMSKRLNVEFDKMIYVGDNPSKDFYIGNTTAVTTVRILRNNGIYSTEDNYLEGIKEMYRVKTLEEVIDIVNQKF